MPQDALRAVNDPQLPHRKFNPSILNWFFLNENGPRAGWRLLLYFAFALVLKFCADMGGSLFLDYSRGESSLANLWYGEISGFAVVFAAALLMARLERRPVSAFGLPLRKAFKSKFWQGVLFGLCEVGLLVGMIAALGGYSFGPKILPAPSAFAWAISWAVFFVFVGLLEEFLFRGYTQFTLGDGIGYWPAAIVLSLAFGAVHLRNPGENWPGIAEIVLTGLLFAFVLRRTGNLWLAVGWHASFDFGESFLFSVPDSGALLPGHLSQASLHGPSWVTGGAVGPEASVFAFLTMGIGALVIQFLYPAKRLETLAQPVP